MGWAVGDEPTRKELSLQMVKVRNELYIAGQMIDKIIHEDKRTLMKSAQARAWSDLEIIAETLTR